MTDATPSKHVPDDQLERLLGFVQQQALREATEEFCTRHGIELEEE